MHGMSLAESAVLLGFHTVRMSFFVLSHVIVALFAFCTCQCNFCAHDFHLHLYYRSSHLPLRYLILSIKKRPKLFHSPVYYTIEISIRQGFLGLFSVWLRMPAGRFLSCSVGFSLFIPYYLLPSIFYLSCFFFCPVLFLRLR